MGVKGGGQQTPPVLPAALTEALVSLGEIDGVDVLTDWQWDSDARCWAIRCRLTVPVPANSPIPRRTDWVVLVEENYPWGFINIHPASRNGVEFTFPHQNLNRESATTPDWRTGRICVDSDVRALGRQGLGREPLSARDRLHWQLDRARRWVAAAAEGVLAGNGDPFELPDLRTAPVPVVAFGEDSSSLQTWQAETETAGTAVLASVRTRPLVLAVTSYRGADGREVYAPRWGAYITDPEREQTWAGWIRLAEPPVLPPWRAAMTWGELRESAAAQGVDLDNQLRLALDPIRGGLGRILLVGFPIPSVIGSGPASYFWQAIDIGDLPLAVDPDRRGFRPGNAPVLDVARVPQLRNESAIKWLRTENWDRSTIAARGRLSEILTTADVLLIGAGALGSAVAEMLVRGGVERLTICDGDIVTAGNLVRHTLGLADVGRYKAVAVAERLNAASPHAVVKAITHPFPPDDARIRAALRPVQIVIECTGENAVLDALAKHPWVDDTVFMSVSLGLRAWAGFSYIAFGQSFPLDAFLREVQPWLDRQAADFAGVEWPREGLGCWHPVFPARVDDVWLLASAAVEHLADFATRLESETSGPMPDPELAVFVRTTATSGEFAGLTRSNGARNG